MITEDFSGFPQSLQANIGAVPYNLAIIGSFQIISNSSFTYHPIIRRCIVLITEKSSLNKVQKR
jgi:hypothetical protein